MGIKKGSSAPSYLDLMQPLRLETWRQDGNCHESKRPRSMLAYWLMNRRNNADPSGISDQQYDLALALCEICPVQWRCVRFAIEAKDNFHIWAVPPDERRTLKAESGWREMLDTAESLEISVAVVVREIRVRHAETVHSAENCSAEEEAWILDTE